MNIKQDMKFKPSLSDIMKADSYINRFLKIRTKDSRIVPLIFNAPQKKLYETVHKEQVAGKPVRIIILKARQMGFSTAVEALIFHSTATRKNISSQITAHTSESTANLFKMSKLFFDELPPPLKPMIKSSNARELIFENPTKNHADKQSSPGLRSKIKCTTAGGAGIGRSDTLTNVHISEYAFWEGDKRSTLIGLLQAVPNLPGTMVIIESTANGFDDFKALWDGAVSGETDFIPLFFPWYEMKEYAMRYDGFQLTEEETNLKTAYSLSNEQLAWRRWCVKNNCGGDIRKFRQEYPASPEEAFIMTGECVFDKEKLATVMTHLKSPVSTGRFNYSYDGVHITDITWCEDSKGEIRIYKFPSANVPYVIGGDTAGEGSDCFTAQVIDNISFYQCAVLQRRLDEDLYARQLFCLGKFYNGALVAVETNYSTHPVRELERLGYPKQYVRESIDDYTHSVRKSYGFVTSSKTRPLLVASLVEYIRDIPSALTDKNTVAELMTFVYGDNRKPQAIAGSHDDLVMALGIALFVRNSQSHASDDSEKRTAWTKDMLDDYRAASPEDKKYLIRKWGKPIIK